MVKEGYRPDFCDVYAKSSPKDNIASFNEANRAKDDENITTEEGNSDRLFLGNP